MLYPPLQVLSTISFFPLPFSQVKATPAGRMTFLWHCEKMSFKKGTKHHMTFQDLCNMSLTFYSGDHYLIMVLCAAVYLNNSSVVKSTVNQCVQKKPMWPPSKDNTCYVHIIAVHCVSYVFITHSKWLQLQSLSLICKCIPRANKTWLTDTATWS